MTEAYRRDDVLSVPGILLSPSETSDTVVASDTGMDVAVPVQPDLAEAVASSSESENQPAADSENDDPAAGSDEGVASAIVRHSPAPVEAVLTTETATPLVPLAATEAQAAIVEVAVTFPDVPEGEADDHVQACCCPACLNPRDDVVEETDDSPAIVGDGTAAGSVASLDEMADYLRVGFWGNGVGMRHNLGETGTDANNGVLYYNVTGTDGDLSYSRGLNDADGISAERAALVRDAFDVYEAVLGIDFVETTETDTDVVDFFFIDNAGGAFASSPAWSDGTIYASYINVQSTWSGGTSDYDDYTLQTIFHEIGHGLGLGHQGRYNGTGGYESDALYVNDSWQASMMSYFSQYENTAIDASYEFLQTPMAIDWLALDDIYSQWGYGADNAFTDDTVYGFNTTISADISRIWNKFSDYAYRTASTIIDAGGMDTIDFSGYGTDQKIDLTVQTGSMTSQNTSDIGGRIGNLTLAIGTVIENAISGSGDDTLVGNEADNTLMGGIGDDILSGKAGDDALHGGDGTDTAVFDSAFADFELEILGDRTSFLLTDTQVADIDDGQDIIFSDFEFIRFGDEALSSIELDDGGLIASIRTDDPAGEALSRLSISENGNTYHAVYSEGIIVANTLTEADGDVRTTLYTAEGTRGSFTFEDGSGSRNWAYYTNTYDDQGARTEYDLAYDNGNMLNRGYAGGITVTNILTEADGDAKTTLYDANGNRDSFTFTDGSDSRSWTSYTNTYDDEGTRTEYDLVYDNDNMLHRSYTDGIIATNILTEADGDAKTTLYDANGNRDSFTFTDGSDSRSWTSYTNTYDDDGTRTEYDLAYDNGNMLHRDYTDGVMATNILTESDGDVLTTLYGADGLRDSFTFEDGSNSRSWTHYINTYDESGEFLKQEFFYDDVA